MTPILNDLFSREFVFSKYGIYYSMFTTSIILTLLSKVTPLYAFGTLIIGSLFIYTVVGKYSLGLSGRESLFNFMDEIKRNPNQNAIRVMFKLFILLLLITVSLWTLSYFIRATPETDVMAGGSGFLDAPRFSDPISIIAVFLSHWVLAVFSSAFSYSSPINVNNKSFAHGIAAIKEPMKAHKSGVRLVVGVSIMGTLGYFLSVEEPYVSLILIPLSTLIAFIYISAFVIHSFGLGKYEMKPELNQSDAALGGV